MYVFAIVTVTIITPILGFLEESDSSLSNIELYDLDGEQLSLESDLTAARHPSHTGVLKIVYEKST